MRVGLSRLSTIHLVLALAKWMEFYEHYKSLVPSHTGGAAKKFCKDLKARGVRDFRNKTVGHLWDDQVKTPLSTDELNQRLEKVIGSDEQECNGWIYNPEALEQTSHLIGLSERIRNALKIGEDASYAACGRNLSTRLFES